MIRNYFVIIIIFWSFISCQEDGSSNNINDLKTLIENKFEIDFENHLIIYNGNSISIENNTLIIEELEFEIKNAYPKLITGEMYDVFYGNEQFSLFISNLPILTISTNGNTIVDEPKVSASITILEKNQMPKSYNMGIELRGRLSKNYPKPSYSFELWSDENKSEKLKESLLNMRKDDDWILDGLWNEPLRIRDFTSHNIWFKIGRVNKKRDHTKTGISRKYCELFIDGKYLGVYYLGERIDRKQLDLKKHNKQLQGELFKGYDWANGVTFSGLDNFDNSIGTWSGYKAKYPSEVGQLDWTNLYKHTSFVVFGQTADFNVEIASRIDLENAVDYFILINLAYATDNTGKNIYTAKFKNKSPYFFIPWDMDGSFGNDKDGVRTDITNKILSNGLYDRLLKNVGFKTELYNRWLELRINELSATNIKAMFNYNYSILNENGIYIREQLVNGLSYNYTPSEMEFIETWIDERLAFLDAYFSSL